MASTTITANQISQPMFAPAGAIVTVTPAAGATAIVEYTKDGAPAVFSGIARWVSWAKGAVSAATSDISNDSVYIRVTAISGAVVINVDENPSAGSMDQFRRDWGGSNTSPIILAQSGVASSVTGTTSETTLASIVIPGGLMGPNGVLRITTRWTCTNNANAKTTGAKFGGQSLGSVGIVSNDGLRNQIEVWNAGSLSAQTRMGALSTAFGFAGVASFAIDTSVDQPLTLYGTLGNSADTLVLRSYTVEVLPA